MNLVVIFNWGTMAMIGISIAVYFIGLGVFVLIKRHLNKKKFNKEIKKHEEEEKKQ